MGRRKGSKNKPKIITPSLENLEDEQREQVAPADSIEIKNLTPGNDTKQELGDIPPIIKRGRGRPRKNPVGEESVKVIIGEKISVVNSPSPIYTNIKNLKREIRQLKKLKLQCRAGSSERIKLHHKIKGMKIQLAELKKQKNIAPIEPIKEIDTKKYNKINFTGELSPQTIERFKKNFGIEFINIGYMREDK